MFKNKPVLKLFLKYSLPTVISMWIFTLYAMIDGMFVGRYVGELGLSGVSIVTPVVNFMFAIGIMIAVGSSTLISICLGQKKYKESNEIFTFSIVFNICLGLTITILTYIFMDKIMVFLNASEILIPYVKDYLSVILYFFVFFMVGYSLEIYLKVESLAFVPIIAAICGALTNIALDYYFVVVLNEGVKGASLATGISQTLVTILMFLILIFKGKRLNFAKFKFSFKRIFEIFSIGFPEFLSEMSLGMFILIYNYAIIYYIGATEIYSFGVIMYLSSLVSMTMIGFSQGIQPVVSFCLGNGNYEMLKKLFRTMIIFSMFFGIIFYGIANIFGETLVSLYLKEKTNVLKTFNILKYYSLSYLLLGINVATASYFTAVKRINYAIIITISRGFIICSLLLFILPRIIGDNGVWLTAFFSEFITLFISIYFIRKQRKFLNKKIDKN